ncbi:MAG TPA: thioredoxin family protein [Kiritimatiellia bacterium]|nr:thioredoxin family protein [Kiritimatiellia bacterium]HMP33777.1 thioredoxin family protein [Kiritimatiellia bacterium]
MKRPALFLIVLLVFATASRGDVWLTDFAAAQERARREDKPMLLNFSGSDWCGWCIRLNNEVFSTPAFITFATQRFVCVLIDSPRRTPLPEALAAQNRALKQRFEVPGFPTILLTTPEGKTLARTGGYRAGGPQAYVDHLDQLLRLSKEPSPAPTEDQP